MPVLASIEKSPNEQVVHLQSVIRDLLFRVDQERDEQCVTLLRPEAVDVLDGVSGALSGEAPKPVPPAAKSKSAPSAKPSSSTSRSGSSSSAGPRPGPAGRRTSKKKKKR